MILIFEFSRSYVIFTIWWARSGVRMYHIVTWVTADVGVPLNHVELMTPFTRLGTVSPVSNNIWPWNSAKNFMLLRRSVFTWDQAAVWIVFSVCPSVCPSHLFDNVPIIVSSWNIQELSPRTRVTSMQKVKVKGQGHISEKRSYPFPECNSSWDMIIKWYI